MIKPKVNELVYIMLAKVQLSIENLTQIINNLTFSIK